MRGKILVSLVLLTLGIHVFSQEPESDRTREAKYKNAIGISAPLIIIDPIGQGDGGEPWHIAYQRLIDRFGIKLTLHDRAIPYWEEEFNDEVRESEIELQVSYAPFWHFFNEKNNINAYMYISPEWVSEYEPKNRKLPFSFSDYSFEYIHAGIGSELSLGHFSVYLEYGYIIILDYFPYCRHCAYREKDFDLGIRIRF